MQREAREAQRFRISQDVSYTEDVRQIGMTTVQNDGAPMAAPVLSGPTVGAGMFSRPVQKSCAHERALSKDILIVTKLNL